MDDTFVQTLADLLAKTLAPDKETIKAAEAQLKTTSQQPGYGICLLKLIASPNADLGVRQSAAVNFKNYVKYRWPLTEADPYAGTLPLAQGEKDQVKQLLTSLMLSTPPLVRSQLSEALSIISTHDFPQHWPTLLPELVSRLKAADLAEINGVLATANSIFKRYRNKLGSSELINELDYSQKEFISPSLETLKKISAQLPGLQQSGQIPLLQEALSCVRFICRIFYSLNSLGLTELVEGQLDEWMSEFASYLQYSNPALTEGNAEKENVLDGVKAAICQNINLFMETSEEEFTKYLKTFVGEVWKLLVSVSVAARPGQDNLAMQGIRFLTTVSRSVHAELYREPGALQQICESIVLPALRPRADEEELFEENPLEYMRRDVEGSDSDTRRRAAADLVKNLVERFPGEVTELCTGYVVSMLAEYAANPANNWQAKDCAMYLVLALTVRGKTGAAGATTTNPLVNIGDFYEQQVKPELADRAVNTRPVIKADALKFLTIFRSQIPPVALLSVFPDVIALLRSEYVVVHSYAASAVERMLALKEHGTHKLAFADVAPFLQPLLEALFAAFSLPDSAENEYVMKALMRVIMFAGPAIAPAAPGCLAALSALLLEVCRNPRVPGFNHYLFESVAALIKNGAAASPALLTDFEQQLFPAFEHVLQQDVQEFHPYVFQIFAQLIELHGVPLPPVYLSIFPPLLSPTFWERAGNVPALVRLLQAYLTKAGASVVESGHMEGVLGVFQKLVASKAHDHEGFFILSALVEFLPTSAFQKYLPDIWKLLFLRLQSMRTPKFVRSLVVFVALLVVKHGVKVAEDTMNAVQPGIFIMLLQQVWLPALGGLDGSEEEKLVLVASTKWLSDSPALRAEQGGQLWRALRDALLLKAEGVKAQAPQEVEVEPEFEEGYSAAYARLANASRPERPVLAEIVDPKQYLQDTLSRLNF